MSGILEKTIDSINSILSPLASNVGLSPKFMYERCLSARTKREEEWCFEDSLRSLRERLSEPGVRLSTVKKALAFVVFAEMMGYKAEFAYIHAVKLAQQGSLSEKKMGYMVCVQLLRDAHPLSMLLVNTVVRDLASRNIVIIAMALAATCHLIPADQAPAVLPMVVDKLTHSNEYVRGKAVIALHHFLRVCPSQAAHYMHQVRPLLGDSDPGVVARVVQYLLLLSEDHPEFVRDLYPSVVTIQNQILTGRLPKEYLYHGISAPWTQVSILQLLRKIHPPLIDVQTVLQDTLSAVANDTSTLAAAISVECLTTMLELWPNPSSDSNLNQLSSATMNTVGYLLGSQYNNLRYEGLGLLKALVSRHHVSLSRDQQAVVLRCLQYTDNAIRLKTLRLLCAIADASTAENISNQVIEYIKNNCTNVHLQGELVMLGMSTAEKYPSSKNHWHLAALLRLLPLALQHTSTIQAHIKLALLEDGESDSPKRHSARKKVLAYLTKHSESKVASTSILELYVWTLSRFHELLSEEDGVTLNSSSHTFALERIVCLGQKVLQNQIQGSLEMVPSEIHKLLLEVVEAARFLVISYAASVKSLPKLLRELISATTTRVFADATLRCSCEELLNILSCCESICEVIKEKDKQEAQYDFTLSFMDDFVCQDLEGSGVPFKPLAVKMCSRAAIQLVLETERNQGDIDLASSVLVAAPCSLGSSELSLAGTENANNWAGSGSSVSSTDSKCWTFTSPTEEIPLTPVWTKEGRIKGEEKPAAEPHPSETAASSPQNAASKQASLQPSISTWLQNSSETDPLDDLSKDFTQTTSDSSHETQQTS